MKNVFYILFVLLAGLNLAYAGNKIPEVGIVEKLGNQIPLDLTFTNSEGQKVQLKDLINKPTVLSFVYIIVQDLQSPFGRVGRRCR